MNKLETRYASGLELRAADANKLPIISGYAAVFNQICSDPVWGEFYELIEPGAFTRALASPKLDVVAVIEHAGSEGRDKKIPIARYRGNRQNNTLKLSQDDYGLKVEIDPADTTEGRDLVTSMKRGDLDGMSFAFRAISDDWTGVHNGLPLRRLKEVWFEDVSIVRAGQYDQASASLRSKQSGGVIMAPEDYKQMIQEIRAKQSPDMVPLSVLELEMQLEIVDTEI